MGFALGGALHTINLIGTPKLCTLNTPKGPYDPRLSPDGRLVGFVADRGLHIIAADGSDLPSVTPLSLPVPEPAAPGKADASHTGGPQHVASRTIAIEDSDEVVWGVADFNAAEEFDRYRGFWWSPDSQSILAARVDNSPVETWWIADPAHPSAKPIAHRYPAAGTPNAIVTLHVLHLEQTVQSGGARLQTVRMSDDATLDHQQWPYLVHVAWTEVGCTAVWMNRAQDHQITVDIDPSTGATRVLTTATDEAWVELLPGTPVRLGEGFLLHAEVGYIDGSNPTSQAGNAETADQGGWPDPQGTHYLVVVDPNGAQRAITPANLQVRRVARVTDTHVVFTANASRPLLGAHSELVRPDPASSSVGRVRPRTRARLHPGLRGLPHVRH